MALNAGTRLGAYEVISAIGSGGMGQVYRARDTRLNRDVAIKLLPDAVAADPERLARFRREAQLLATLNHPNIAQIYGVEESSTAQALVMELVPGRTLDDTIRAGPTPWADVVPIARQIAEALESAHESGIVHRDLKPANIKIRDDGAVKVLDFGLAVARPGAGSASGAGSGADSATITSPAVTELGVILGTAAYMSPEQARGRPVDKRADIWAFGVVLFELLTGHTLFAGNSVTDTIAAVIKDDPGLDRLPAETPPALRALIARCLERDPARRLRDIGEARILLSGPFDQSRPETSSRAASARARRASWIAAGAGAIALAVAAAAVAWWMKPAAAQPLRRLELALPATVTDYAISGEGGRLAYIADTRLYVRRLDELDPRDLGRLHVTAGDLHWSPDDRTIAFTAESKIQTIPADGGPTFVVTQVPASGRVMDMDWLSQDTIVFSVWRDSIYRVPATGGTAAVLLSVDAAVEIDFHDIAALPGDRLVVATHRRKEDADVIELIELTGGRRRIQLTDNPDARGFEYVSPGLLTFFRATTNVGVWAVPFREGPLDVNDATLLQAGAADYRIARDGTLVAMIPAPSRSALVWIDDTGAETRVPGDDVESPEPLVEISPDGGRAAFVQGRWSPAGTGVGSLTDATVVVRDLGTGVDTRLSAGAPSSTMWGAIGSPAWFPDGQRLVHRTGRVEGANLVERRADIAGNTRVLTQGMQGRILPDGRTLIYTRDERGVGRLDRASVETDGRVGPGRALFPNDPQPNVGDFDISADGRLIAYVARRPNGRGDIFLAQIDRPAEHWLVNEGGSRPRFSRDARQLFFVRGVTDVQGQPHGEIVRVSIEAAPVSIGPPVVVYRDRPGSPRIATFDTAPDGRRFLMWKPAPPRPGERERLVLVQNGLTAMRR